jgi:hypothetical protein
MYSIVTCKHGYELTNVRKEMNSYNYPLLSHIVQQLPHCIADSLSTFCSYYLCYFVQRLPSPFRTAITLSNSALYPDSHKPFLFQYWYSNTFFLLQAVKKLPSQPLGTAAPLSQAVQCKAAILSSHGCALVQQLPSPPKPCTEASLSSPTMYRSWATLSS